LIDPAQFYDQVDVIFEGVMTENDDVRKSLSDELDDIVQKLPDGDVFTTPGAIYFSSPAEIIERWEHNPPVIKTNVGSVEAQASPQYLERMKWINNQLYDLSNIRDSDALYDALDSIDWTAAPDGNCQPVGRWDEEKNWLEFFGYVIDIILDLRTLYRAPDYVKGVICHEFVEFSTKWNVLREHKDEIKKLEDINKILTKYLKSGYFPPAKQYYEHEEIVNREAKQLGFEKYIAVMEKFEFRRIPK
jgi:hypothetical protein